MNVRSSRDRAAIWLGMGALLSLVFLVVKRELHFVQIPDAGIAVVVVLGPLAIAGGWLASRALTLIAGAGFLLAAIVQLILHTNGNSLASGSNGSTFGLWLGLGFGLLALAVTRQQSTDSPEGM
jgi:hypothetical protein